VCSLEDRLNGILAVFVHGTRQCNSGPGALENGITAEAGKRNANSSKLSYAEMNQ
jgi:hypothetical protein